MLHVMKNKITVALKGNFIYISIEYYLTCNGFSNANDDIG